MSRRVTITQGTLDRWSGRDFAWGKADCVRMARDHLKAMGRPAKVGLIGRYGTALGARRALVRKGYADLAEALDAQYLPRIPLARASEGDIVAGEGDDAFHALGIYLGNNAVLGFHSQTGKAGPLRLVDPGTILCWEVIPA